MCALPLEGIDLREFVVEGNGKYAEVTMVTREGRRFTFATSGSDLEISVQGTVLTEVTGPDDPSLQIRYSASRLVLVTARIHHPGTAEECADDMAAFSD